MILLRKLSKSSSFKRISPFVPEDHLKSVKIQSLLETSACWYLQQRFWSFRGICGQEGSFTKWIFQNSLKDQTLQLKPQCGLAGTRAFCVDNSMDLKPVHWSPRVISEAEAALMDYLHSTSRLDFLDAEHMSKNSPIFLHKLLEKIGKEEEIGRAMSRFLRYHPINEFEPFFESMGLQPSEYGPFLPRELMYLHDSLELLENYHALCNYGFARSKLGDIYKEATEVFGYESGVLHTKFIALEELGLSKTSVIKIVSPSPTLLIKDNVDLEFLKVLEELDEMGIERDWIAEGLSKNGFCGWGRMLVVMNFFLSMGFSKKELGSSIRKHPDFFLNGQTTFLLVGWLLKIGAPRKDICSLLREFPPVQVGKFLEKLRLGLLFLIEMEMDTEGIREILCMHTEFLGLHILMRPSSILTYLSTGRKRLRNLIRQDPEMLKKFVMGSKVSRLQKASGGEISIKQKKQFLSHLGLVEGSREMQKALSVFRGKGDELQGRFDFLVRCGLDQNDVREMIKVAPHVLNQKIDVLEKKINFLVHNLGFPIRSLVAFPSYMSFTIERVKLRFLMYNWLKDRGNAKPSLALSSVLACSDKVFTKLFISHHPQGLEVWEEFKKTVYSS